MNGQRETANAFLVNGSDVSEGRNLGAGLIPNLDSIAEFRLITNSFDAEYGRFSGSVMNAITKSGTNGIHGSAFEFLRNDHFDARNFFDPTKAELRQNQFGYAVGGPFWKNRIFWFTDYQGTRQVSGASTGLVSVPTDAQRGGNFGAGAFVDANGNPTLVQGAYWAQVLSQRLGQPVQNGEAYNARVPEWRDSAIGVVGAFDRNFAVHSRSQRWRRTLRGLEPKGDYQRRQDWPARGFQQSEDRQLVVLLSQRLVERVRAVGGRERSWFPGHHADQRSSRHSEQRQDLWSNHGE